MFHVCFRAAWCSGEAERCHGTRKHGVDTGIVSASKNEAFSPTLPKPPKTLCVTCFRILFAPFRKASRTAGPFPPAQTCFLFSIHTPQPDLAGLFCIVFQMDNTKQLPQERELQGMPEAMSPPQPRAPPPPTPRHSWLFQNQRQRTASIEAVCRDWL